MENYKKIYLVITYIEKCSGKARSYYQGDFEVSECLMLLSFNASHGDLGVPLWFPSAQAARDYIVKAESNMERIFHVIQEFVYPPNTFKNEAKIVFHCKSHDWIIMADGRTERSPGLWADVRTFSICDKTAAEDYVRRFNEDAAKTYEHYMGKK